MNKKTLTILGIAILVVIAIGFWFAQKNKTNVISTETERSQSTEESENTVIPTEEETQEENATARRHDLPTGQAGEAISGREENIKNIQPEFGINDSQLNYNEYGRVDMSNWETFEHLGYTYSLPLNWSIIITNSVNGSMSITNLSDYEIFEDALTDVNLLAGYVKISTESAPFDGGAEMSQRRKELFKKDTDSLLTEIAEVEIKSSSFNTCVNGSRVISGKREFCEISQPKCVYGSVEEKFGRKYIITECFYDKKDTDEKQYILNKTIITSSAFEDDKIIEYSISLKANEKDLIDINKKIFLNLFDEVLDDMLKQK